MSTENFESLPGGFPTEKIMHTSTTGNYRVTMERTASWCPNCGRRRNPDGRCAECDPWWTMPAVQYGGGLAILVVLALLGGISLTQSHNAGREVRSLPSVAGGGHSTSGFGTTPASPLGGYSAPLAYTPPVYTPPPYNPSYSSYSMTPVNFARTMPPSTEELQRQDIEQLRMMTAYTDSVVEQQRQQRWEQQRIASQQGTYYQPSSHYGRGAELAIY